MSRRPCDGSLAGTKPNILTEVPVSTTSQDLRSTRSATGGRRYRAHRRRWLTVLASMATATAAWGIAESLLGIDLAVRDAASSVQQVSALPVTLVSLVVGLAGWALLVLLERWTPKASLVWRVIAAIVFLVSLLGPLTAVTPAATAVLVGMHGMVAAILTWGLTGSNAAVRDGEVRPHPEAPHDPFPVRR